MGSVIVAYLSGPAVSHAAVRFVPRLLPMLSRCSLPGRRRASWSITERRQGPPIRRPDTGACASVLSESYWPDCRLPVRPGLSQEFLRTRFGSVTARVVVSGIFRPSELSATPTDSCPGDCFLPRPVSQETFSHRGCSGLLVPSGSGSSRLLPARMGNALR